MSFLILVIFLRHNEKKIGTNEVQVILLFKISTKKNALMLIELIFKIQNKPTAVLQFEEGNFYRRGEGEYISRTLNSTL